MVIHLKFELLTVVILGTLGVFGTLGWLAFGTTTESAGYFKTVPEVTQMGEKAQAKPLRVSGYVKEGSIKREGSKTAFLLVDHPGDSSAGDNLTVVYDGGDPLPTPFKDRAQAVADGKLGADGVFHANQIQAKCTTFADCASFEFDIDKPVTLRGKVTQLEWINPHARIHLDVQSQDGSVQNWMAECGPPGTLLRNGLTKDSLPEGMEIVVYGYAAKDGTLRLNSSNITFTRKLSVQPAGLK